MAQPATTRSAPGLDPFVLELREFHQKGLERIREKHKHGAGGFQTVEATTGLMDQVVVRAWRHALADTARHSGKDLSKTPPRVALMGIGGYGRAQLNPGSDVDIMFFHKSSLTTVETDIIKKTLQTLWDTGLEIGHSARTWSDCVRISSEDVDTRTSLLENRYLAGDREIQENFHKKYRAHIIRQGCQAFFRQKQVNRRERYRKHGDTVALQEPNIKESAGGLRDLHHGLWLTIAMYDIPSLAGMRRRGLLREPFFGRLMDAVDFIFRIRNELHFHQKSAGNRLTFEIQEKVAKAFGYHDEGVNMAEESLMRDYYAAATCLQQFADMMTIRCLQPSPLKRLFGSLQRRNLGDGFFLREGQLTVEHPETFFLEDPERVVRVFEIQQETACDLQGDLSSELSQYVASLRTEEISGAASACDRLVEMLKVKGKVGPVFRAMYETMFLDVLIPEFKVIRYLPRRDLYHKYTVDEHSMITVEILDGLSEDQAPKKPVMDREELAERFPGARRRWRWWGVPSIWYEGSAGELKDSHPDQRDVLTLPVYSQAGERVVGEIKNLFSQVESPHLLYLATFMHDIGKGRGGEHHLKGAAIACEVCRRLGLSDSETDLVIFLVEKHLEFARIAFRFDTRDFGVVQQFASWCNTRTKLDYLYLLTLADIWAVSTELLTEWKMSMLHQFYTQVRDFLDNRLQVELERSERRKQIYEEFIATLPRDIDEGEAEKHLGMMPEKYLTQHTADQLHFQMRLLRKYTGEHPVVDCRQTMMNVLEVVTIHPSKIGRFMRVVRSLSSLNLSISEARLFARDDGLAICTLLVAHNEGATLREEYRERIIERTVLSLEDQWDENWNPRRLHTPPQGKFRFEPHVEVYNRVSPQYTVIEVRCADEIGVLVKITTILAKYGLDIVVARIHTEQSRVFDTFYVLDSNRQKFEDTQKINWLKSSLVKALESS
jgi:[protein-PII] uridylyltransferase